MENKNQYQDIDFAFEKRVREAVNLTEREHLMSFISDIESEFQKENPDTSAVVKPLHNNRWLRIAASLFLVAAAYFTFQSVKGPSTDQIVAEFYEPYPNTYNPITRSQVQEVNIEFQGLMNYEGEQYKEALAFFNQLPQANDNILMFKAISKLELDDLAGAKADLKTLIDKKGKLANTAQWYMGMALAKEGQLEQAKSYFQILASQHADSSRQRDASRLLEKLK